MSEFNGVHTIILRSDIPAGERKLLSKYFKVISSGQENDFLYLDGVKVDASHHTYIEIEIENPKNQRVFVLRLPHSFVFLLDASDSIHVALH